MSDALPSQNPHRHAQGSTPRDLKGRVERRIDRLAPLLSLGVLPAVQNPQEGREGRPRPVGYYRLDWVVPGHHGDPHAHGDHDGVAGEETERLSPGRWGGRSA